MFSGLANLTALAGPLSFLEALLTLFQELLGFFFGKRLAVLRQGDRRGSESQKQSHSRRS